MASEAGSYTPETIARRRALAEALYNKKQQPMTHWMQGVAQLGDTFTAGMLEQKNKKEEKEGRAAIADFLLGAQQPAATSSAPQMAPQAPVSTAPTNGKVYANDEPSPLDPPSGQDRDMAIRTILAEAGNQPQVGKEAVAAVLRNRAAAGNFGGDTLPGVIQKPNQFEPWNTPKGRANMAAIDPNSPAYAQAGQALESAYAGQDPTMGATHFYAPKAQAALGRPAPSWDNGTGRDIADHRFFGGAGTPPVMAGASPSDVSAQARGMPQQAPQTAPATPQAAPGAPQGNDVRAKIAQMLKSDNSYVRQMGTQLANQLIQQQMATPSFDFKVAGENLYRVNPKTGQAEPVGAATKPSYGVIGKDQFGNEQYGWIDPAKRSVTPGQQPAQEQPTPQPQPAPGGVPGQPPQAAMIPPAPPGANPKVWRDMNTKLQAERAAAQPEKDKQAKATADIVTTDIDRAIKTMDDAILPTTGAIGGALSNIGGTAARDLSGLLDTVKANAGFDTLAKMRAASPTGGALGSITEKELALLQATIGNLEQSQTADQLKDNLRRVKNTYLDVIHGPGNGPPRETLKFNEKKPGGSSDIDALLQKYAG